MVETARRSLSFVARVVAVTFALAVLGYLVVTAQQRANPPSEVPSEAPVVAEPAGAVPQPGETFLPSSKVLVIEDTVLPTEVSAEAAAPAQDPAFLFGSKSMVISSDALNATSDPAPTFLPSSKVGAVIESAPSEPAPQFLPSSKAKVPMPVGSSGSRPKSQSSGQVLLPSSKSFRLHESPLPAVRPPQEP